MNHSSSVSDSRIRIFPWKVNTGTMMRIYKRRRVFVLKNIHPWIDCTLGVNEPNLATLTACLTGRLFYMYKNGVYHPPLKYQGCSSFERQFAILKHTVGSKATVRSHEQVVSTYHGRKKTLYSKASESLSIRPLERKDGYSRFFMKFEKINTKKVPRCIQPRSVRYHLSLAAYLKHEEHYIYKCIGKMFGYDVVAKGKNIKEVGKMFTDAASCFDNPCFIELDAEKFDMHVTREVLELEHSIYLHMYKNDRFLAKMLDWQIHNRGTASTYDGYLKFSIKGTRFSGDINTSLGNVIIMCLMLKSYFDNTGKKYKLINNGDDAVVVCERRDLACLDGITAHSEKCGFRIKVENISYELEKLRFCQMAPVFDGEQYTMVRDPKNLFQKDVMSFHNLTNRKIREKWMYAVGYGGLAMYGNIPILRDFYHYYYRYGNPKSKMLLGDREIQSSAYFYWGRGMLPEYRDIDPRARLSFFKAFDYTPDEQEKFERHYAKLPNTFIIEDFPIYERSGHV